MSVLIAATGLAFTNGGVGRAMTCLVTEAPHEHAARSSATAPSRDQRHWPSSSSHLPTDQLSEQLPAAVVAKPTPSGGRGADDGRPVGVEQATTWISAPGDALSTPQPSPEVEPSRSGRRTASRPVSVHRIVHTCGRITVVSFIDFSRVASQVARLCGPSCRGGGVRACQIGP